MTINVAFAGLKGAGKDTAADVLVAKGWHKIGMADGIREMLRANLRYRGVGIKEIERMLDGDLKRVASPHFNGKTPTYVMQTLGSEWARDLISNSFWLDTIDDRMKLLGREVPVAVTGVRFQHEVDFFKERGFLIVRIRRPGFEDLNDKHSTEASVLNLKVDHEIHNETFETPHDFQRFVKVVLHGVGVLTD